MCDNGPEPLTRVLYMEELAVNQCTLTSSLVQGIRQINVAVKNLRSTF